MRAVHLISGGDVGGAKTHVLSLLQGMSARMGITLVCFRDGPFAEEARALGIDTRVVHGNGLRGDLRALSALIQNGKYDIVHSHGSRGNTMSALLKMVLQLPTVSTLHSDYKLDYLGAPLRAISFGTLNRWALTKMDYYIGVSDPIADMLIERGFRASRMFSIYNGLDFSQPIEIVDRAAYWRRHNVAIGPQDVVVGIAARFDHVKNVGLLIEAFGRIALQCPTLCVAIAGDGALRATLEARVAQLGLVKRVHFLGWVNDMEGFYQAIDINALTSRSETFPYALTEGAKHCKPTVATQVGGIPRLIDHGVSGLLVPPQDAEQLAAALRQLYDNADMRASMGARLGQKAREKFSLTCTLDTQEAIYKAILARHARPRKHRDGITLCGAYGYGNAGDDGILTAILAQIRAIDATTPVRVLSRTPKTTASQFRVDTLYTFNPFALIRALRRSDLYLNGGGNLIQDVTSSRSLWFYLLTIRLAKLCGTKVLMYSCGVGPLKRKSNQRLTAKVLSKYVDAITMREDHTLRELTALGVKIPQMVLTADPALSLTPAPPEAVDSVLHGLGLPLDGQYLCLAVRDWPGFSKTAPAFAAMCDRAYRDYGLVTILLPFSPQLDTQAARAVMNAAESPCVLAKGAYEPQVLIGLMARMRIVVGMRLHALIFAAAQGVPLVGVSYDSKATAFLQYLGQEFCCSLTEATPEKLQDLLCATLSRPDNTSDRLAAVLRLQALEQGNSAMLRDMMGAVQS